LSEGARSAYERAEAFLRTINVGPTHD
jgi:hypothetical protein